MKGESSPLISLTSHMGTGSCWHVLFGVQLISFTISSVVTAVNSTDDDVIWRGTSYIGVVAVDVCYV